MMTWYASGKGEKKSFQPRAFLAFLCTEVRMGSRHCAGTLHRPEGRTPGRYATGAVPRSSARARALTLGTTMRAGRGPLGSSPSAVKQREGGRRAEGRAGANRIPETPPTAQEP